MTIVFSLIALIVAVLVFFNDKYFYSTMTERLNKLEDSLFSTKRFIEKIPLQRLPPKPHEFDIHSDGVNVWSAIWQPLYDWQKDVNREKELTFFQEPIGINASIDSDYGDFYKTTLDTNMDLEGCLPDHNYMVVTSITIGIVPGCMDKDFRKIIYQLGASGELFFFVGSKVVFQLAPLDEFFRTFSWSTVYENFEKQEGYKIRVPFDGYAITPIVLHPHQNFCVKLGWREPIAADCRIGVILGGFRYRPAS